MRHFELQYLQSIAAIACSGTFYFTIIGDAIIFKQHGGSKYGEYNNYNNNNIYNNNNNNNNKNDVSDDKSVNGKQTIALQVIAPGGTASDKNAVKGRIFVGQDNIDKNIGQKFDIN
jgi:hypothetical protein